MDKKLPDLAPCPFCGSKDVKVYKSGVIDEFDTVCDGCGACFFDQSSLESAILAWNRRA